MLRRSSIILVGQGREEVHPLVNSTILRHIFGFLNVENLRSARATCTSWKEGANSLLQNNSEVTITWFNVMDERSRPSLPTFMKYVESVTPEHVFFRNYVLFGWRLHSKELKMTLFWLQCGQHIQNLVLKNDNFRFYEESYVRNVFYNWTPNMESLHIKDVEFINNPNYKPLASEKKTRRVAYADEDGENSEEKTESEEETESEAETESEDETGNDSDYDDDLDSERKPMQKFEIVEDIQPNHKFRTFRMEPMNENYVFPLQWKELFIVYPNLETLSVRPVVWDIEVDVDNIKELLTDLIEFHEANPNKLQNLKRLDIFSPYLDLEASVNTDEHFKEAMKLNLKLESLDLDFPEIENLSYSVIAKYISKLRTSLKKLEISVGRESMTLFPPPGNRILFPSLISLRIQLDVLSTNNVEFLQTLPKLEVFVINDSRGKDFTDPRLFCNTITLKPMNTLHTFHANDILTEDCIQKIGEWFPNLSTFGAVFDNNLLWATYKFLYKSVDKLVINGNGITDAGITGSETTKSSNEPKPSSSKSVTQERPTKRRKQEYGVKDQRIMGTCISQMKKLQQLTIIPVSIPVDSKAYARKHSEPVQLTDEAVYSGFIRLTELTHLTFGYCNEKITEGAFRDLCSRRNITLETDNFYRGTPMTKMGMFDDGRRFPKKEI